MSSLVSLVRLPLRLVLRISSHMSETLSRVVHTDLLIISVGRRRNHPHTTCGLCLADHHAPKNTTPNKNTITTSSDHVVQLARNKARALSAPRIHVIWSRGGGHWLSPSVSRKLKEDFWPSHSLKHFCRAD